LSASAGSIMFRIRLHGRGGQGTKTASQILGTAFFLQGFEVQDAPRYGAERRGAPIFAYVRAARAPIGERGVITRPDLVVVADETLIPVPAAGVLQGVSARTVLLVNSAEPGETWQARLGLEGPVLAFPAGADVAERAEMPYVGAVCAGAAARLTGVISRDRLVAAMRNELGRHGEGTLEKNLARALAAFDAMGADAGRVVEGAGVSATAYRRPDWIDLPFDDARVSAPDIHAEATSEFARTGLWRTLRPVIDYALCNRCSWVCSTLCPDGAIRVEADRTPRVDYDQCKGCAVCVTVCPPHAISAIPERQAKAEGAAA
jgi:pyruvate ferredoxin oxidoreductase gamma subunit